MTTAAYRIGQARRLTVNFSDVDGAAADPLTVTFVMREPDGTETSYTFGGAEIQKTGTGAYYVDWTFAQAGRHRHRWKGAGDVIAVNAEESYVLQPDLEAT